MRHKHLGAILALTILAVAVGCNAGGSSSTTPPSPAPAPASGPFTVVAGGSTFLDMPGVGNTTAGAVTLPAPTSGGGTTGTFSVSATNPVSAALLGDKKPASVAGANGLWYLTLTFNDNVTIPALPAMQVEFKTAQPTTVVYWSAIYKGTSWIEPWSGPGAAVNGGMTVQIPAKAATPFTFTAGVAYTIAVYSSPATPTPTPSPTPVATPTPTPTPPPNALVNGDFETSSSSFAPWYTCYVSHDGAQPQVDPNPVNPPSAYTSPNPGPSPTVAPTTAPTPTDATVQQSVAMTGGANGPVHGGLNAALVGMGLGTGTANSGKGAMGICQNVVVPANSPTISLWVLEGGDKAYFDGQDQEAGIFTAAAGLTSATPKAAVLPSTYLFMENNCWNGLNAGTGNSAQAPCAIDHSGSPDLAHGNVWRKKGPYDLSAYVGQTVTVFLGIYTSSTSTTYYNYAYYDDVLLTHS